MRPTIRHTVAAAAVAVTLPLLSACTVTFGSDSKTEGAATPTASAPTSAPGAPSATSEAPQPTPTQPETPHPATPTQAAPAPPQSPAPTTSGAAGTGPGMGSRRRIVVPPGHGVQSLELIDVYGGRTSSGAYGKAVGVFQITTDRPLLINLRLQLFDAAGKEIANNTGLNSSYVVGTHTLVTSNLIKLPDGVQPASFKVQFVDTTDMRSPIMRTFGQPTIGSKNGVPTLTGAFGYTGTPKSTLDADGACVLPGGKVVQGQESILDNPTTRSGDTTSGTYEIPLYDAKGLDLSKATCYASA